MSAGAAAIPAAAEYRLINGTLVLPDRLVADGAVQVRDGRIAAVGPAAGLPRWSGPVADAGGAYIAPGYIDMHVHGGDGADFMDGTAEAFETAVRAHTRHGTTGIVPTTTVARHEQTLTFLRLARRFRQVGAAPGRARVLGAHFYGPYFAEDKVGCHPRTTARPPTPAEYEQYLEFADTILVATCAAELPGAVEFYKAAAARGVRLNAGHSNATWTEMEAAYRHGVRHVDHFYCAMSSVPSLRVRCGTPMQASMAEFVLAHADMTTEVIADGRHLSPELLRFVLQMKGADGTALVTDCNRALDRPEGRYMFGNLEDGEPFIHEGGVGWAADGKSLASSVRGMDFMVRHMVQAVGVEIPTAVRMATRTPARILGLERDYGTLEVGKAADILLLDKELVPQAVVVAGRVAAG
jgi:N-acetylglucosamine-6-phosphate deacetylase